MCFELGERRAYTQGIEILRSIVATNFIESGELGT